MNVVFSISFGIAAALALASCTTSSVERNTAPQRISANSIEEVSPLIERKIDAYGTDRVLVVFDVDDTLLTMSQDIGGVGWYDWQDSLSEQAGVQPGELGSTLFDVQGVLFESAKMKPVEDGTRELLDALRSRGVATHGLTARGPDYFGATYRELRKNKLELGIPTKCEGVLCDGPGVLTFNEVKDALLESFTMADLQDIGIKSSRPALVANGVLMVAGQHKGLMLHLLIESYPNSEFDAIVFVDDSSSNVDDLMEMAVRMSQDVSVVHYERLNDHNATLQDDIERTAAAERAWTKIEAAICEAMVSRVCK